MGPRAPAEEPGDNPLEPSSDVVGQRGRREGQDHCGGKDEGNKLLAHGDTSCKAVYLMIDNDLIDTGSQAQRGMTAS